MRKQHGGHGHGHEPVVDPRDTDVDYLKTLGYEQRDVNVTNLAKWIAGLFVFVFGNIVLAFGVYHYFVPNGAEERRSLPQNAIRREPPTAVVQAHPRRDMVVFRREDERKVNGYGWVDQSKGVARMPVDRAIEELARQGPPTAASVGGDAAAVRGGGMVAPSATSDVRGMNSQ